MFFVTIGKCIKDTSVLRKISIFFRISNKDINKYDYLES